MTRKLNLGCGDITVQGWINIDNSLNARLSQVPFLRWMLWKIGLLSDKHYKVKWAKDIVVRELTKPLPFADNSVAFVYSSHFVEHLSFIDAKKLISEIYRVLAPGGVVRLVLPDLKFYILKYIREKDNKETADIAADNFIKSMNIITKSRDPHMWMYDIESISKRFKEAGFTFVEKCEYRQGRCPDIDKLDYLPEDSLWVEGVK